MTRRKPRLALVLGIRPDVIRASKIIKLLKNSELIEFDFIWSGQHYSSNLKDVFFNDLNLPYPDFELDCGGSTDAAISSSVINNLYELLKVRTPDACIFLGDTNTVLGSIAAAQLNIPIVHIEGCMRSYDWRMPEEKCRTIIDHISDVIYTYFDEYKQQGIAEGLRPDSIVVIQNLIVDVLNEEFLGKREVYEKEFEENLSLKYKIRKNEYYVSTIHRRENVENPIALKNILNFMNHVKSKVIFTASYRTQKMLKSFNFNLPSNVTMIDPIGYREILSLMQNSYAVLTDSGTIVEETAIIGVPSVQVRKSTERPQVYDCKSSIKFDPLVKESTADFNDLINKLSKVADSTWNHGLGDGRSSDRLVGDLLERASTPDGFRNHLPEKYHIDISRSYSNDNL